MRLRFRLDDTSSPFHGLDLPVKTGKDLSLNDTAEVLAATGWRLADLHDHLNRTTIAGIQRVAMLRGQKIEHLVELTAEDDVIGDILLNFATLRAAGHKVTWEQAGEFKEREVKVLLEPGDRISATAAEVDAAANEDPQVPPTDSVLAVGGASTEQQSSLPDVLP